MLEKRGQLTLFIIAGVVIAVAIIGYFFILGQFGFEKELDFDSKSEVVRVELLECMEEIYKDSLDLVGLQGGYYNEPFVNYEVQNEGAFLSYYIDDDGYFLPPIEFIESELGMAVDSTLDYCFKAVSLGYPEFEIFFSEFNTTVSIRDDDIGFVTLMDVVIAGENKTTLLEFNEEKEILSKLRGAHDLADYYLYMNMLYGENIPADGLVEIARQEEISVDVTNYAEGVLMVSVFPSNDLIYPRMFNFLHRVGEFDETGFGTEELSFDDVESELNEDDFNEGFV